MSVAASAALPTPRATSREVDTKDDFSAAPGNVTISATESIVSTSVTRVFFHLPNRRDVGVLATIGGYTERPQGTAEPSVVMDHHNGVGSAPSRP